MYRELVDRKFVCKADHGIKHISILASIPSEFFSEEGFLAYAEGGPEKLQSPGAVINNKSNFISFLVKDMNSLETFRVSEYDLLISTDGLTSEELSERIEEYEVAFKIDKSIEKFGEVGFDKHYYKCQEMGMSEDEALDSIIQFIKVKQKINENNGK